MAFPITEEEFSSILAFERQALADAAFTGPRLITKDFADWSVSESEVNQHALYLHLEHAEVALGKTEGLVLQNTLA